MKKVIFISSTGGHLTELLQLAPLFPHYDSYFITEKQKNNLSLKEKYGKKKVFFIDLIAGNLLISPRKCL